MLLLLLHILVGLLLTVQRGQLCDIKSQHNTMHVTKHHDVFVVSTETGTGHDLKQ